MDSASANAGFSDFIGANVGEPPTSEKSWPLEFLHKFSKTLQEKVGGTFLWASLILDDICRVKMASNDREKAEGNTRQHLRCLWALLKDVREEYILEAILLLR